MDLALTAVPTRHTLLGGDVHRFEHVWLTFRKIEDSIFFFYSTYTRYSKIGTDIVSPKVADLFSSHTTQTCDACGCEKKKFVAFVVSRYSYFFVHRGAGAVDHGLSILHTKTTLVFRYGADG